MARNEMTIGIRLCSTIMPSSHMHTTHTHTHTYMHTHTQNIHRTKQLTLAHPNTCTHTPSHTHIHTHIYTHTHVHTHTHIHTYTHTTAVISKCCSSETGQSPTRPQEHQCGNFQPSQEGRKRGRDAHTGSSEAKCRKEGGRRICEAHLPTKSYEARTGKSIVSGGFL